MSDMHKFREMLAKQLKEMRVNTDMTQAKLSEQMGVSVVHLSNLENGHSLPSIELLRKYESFFGFDPYCATNDLLCWARHNKEEGNPWESRYKRIEP
jgi:transcriptional regulator with XRE-family HTH domain